MSHITPRLVNTVDSPALSGSPTLSSSLKSGSGSSLPPVRCPSSVDSFVTVFPVPVAVFWLTLIALYLVTLLYFLIQELKSRTGKGTKSFNPYNPPVDIEYLK